MTTVLDANVHNIAVNGTFDDCQAIVKALFNDLEFRDRMALSGVNSINWARVVAQSVYYFTAAAALGAPDRTCAFSVPTGNFGDIYAGYIAERMGLGVERLVLATNVNDILVRTLDTGRYQVGDVVATQSPSMDIQVASNFERFVFEARGRDAEAVRGMMADLKDKGGFSLGGDVQAEARRVFAAHRVNEAQTVATIAHVYRETGMVVDPHTAVGIAAGRRARASEEVRAGTPLVHLATAHPAKFPDAVEKAVGFRPQLPSWLADLEQREERVTVLDPDPKTIAGFIEAHVAGPAGAAPVGGAA
jgi:threonine synthase